MNMLVLLITLIVMFTLFTLGGAMCDKITERLEYDRKIHKRRRGDHKEV